ncbi:MAG: TonB-dependent receptor plug domain-containing protein, partial [Bacteroidota bacterium]
VEAGGRKQAFFLTKQEPVVLAMPTLKVKGQVLPFANRTVEGVVLDDATGSPLVGAIVRAAGTKFEVVTGEDGKFQIFLPLAAQGFIVKYQKRKASFPLSADSFFTLRLPLEMPLESADSLRLQTQIRQTAAVAEVGSEHFNEGHLTDPVQLAQGKIAGLGIARAGDNPNEAFAIRLRGIHSLTQNATPLFVVDGFAESSLQAIDPLDVAQIRVLKDASAAAKYGIRGSAGVIEIETKQPGGEGIHVDYQAYAGVETVKEFLPVAGRDKFLSLGGVDEGGETHWYDEITQTARQLATHVGIQGGKANTRYRLSLGYRQAEGTLRETGFYNLNLRGRIAQSFFKNKLKINALLGANVRPASLGFPQAWGHAVEYNPTAPIRGTDTFAAAHGGYFTRFQAQNPVAMIDQNIRQSLTTAYLGQVEARWNLPAGFFVGNTLARQVENENETTFYDEDGALRGLFRSVKGAADQARLDRTNDLWTAKLGQQAKFWKIGLDWQAGYSFQRIRNDWTLNEIDGFSRRPFSFEPLENTTLDAGAMFFTKEKTGDVHDLSAWFASAGFDFDGWVFVDASLRREGSSRLGFHQNQGWFHGVSAGVNVNKWLNANWLDYLKPRFGFGRTGGVPAEPYLSQRLVVKGSSFTYLNGEKVPGVRITGMENSDLKWETRSERNLGFDVSFAKGRLFGSLDFFRSKASDLIRKRYLENSTSQVDHYIWENSAAIKNRGVEWNLGAVIFQKENFTWQVGLQRSTARSTLEKLSATQKTEAFGYDLGNGYNNRFISYHLEEGKPLGELYGYVTVNGDPDNLKREDSWNYTWAVVGNGLPEKLLGAFSEMRYKSLDFSFLLRGAYGHSLVNFNRLLNESPHLWWGNVLLTEGFKEERNSSNSLSDYYVEDASYTQIQYATLGYRFHFGKSRVVKNLRLAVTAQNLFTLTKYQGADPEVRYEFSLQHLEFQYLNSLEARTEARPDARLIGVDAPASWLPGRIWSLQVQAG